MHTKHCLWGWWALEAGSDLSPSQGILQFSQKGRAETIPLLAPVSDCQDLTLPKSLLLLQPHYLSFNEGSSHPPSLRRVWLCLSLEGRAAGEVAAEVTACPTHPAWETACSTYPWGCASLPSGLRCPGQGCTDATLGQSHLATFPSQQPGPLGMCCPCQRQCRPGPTSPSNSLEGNLSLHGQSPLA